MSAQRHCLEIEIVEDVLSDAQVRELRAFAVMARGEFLGLDVHVPPLFAGSHVAIAWLQRKGLLAGAKLTFAGWKYLASIDRQWAWSGVHHGQIVALAQEDAACLYAHARQYAGAGDIEEEHMSDRDAWAERT